MTTYTDSPRRPPTSSSTAVKPLSELTKTFADAASATASASCRRCPRPEGLPTALEVVTAHFAFAEKLLAAQKDFAFELAGARRQPEAAPTNGQVRREELTATDPTCPAKPHDPHFDYRT